MRVSFWLTCWFLLSHQWVQMWPEIININIIIIIIHLPRIQRRRADPEALDWREPSGSWYCPVYICSWPCNSCLFCSMKLSGLDFKLINPENERASRRNGPVCDGAPLPHSPGHGRSEPWWLCGEITLWLICKEAFANINFFFISYPAFINTNKDVFITADVKSKKKKSICCESLVLS